MLRIYKRPQFLTLHADRMSWQVNAHIFRHFFGIFRKKYEKFDVCMDTNSHALPADNPTSHRTNSRLHWKELILIFLFSLAFWHRTSLFLKSIYLHRPLSKLKRMVLKVVLRPTSPVNIHRHLVLSALASILSAKPKGPRAIRHDTCRLRPRSAC